MTADVSMSQSSGHCPSCPHPVRAHSREPGVGCLHTTTTPLGTWTTRCPCTEPGDSEADQ